MSKPAHMPEGTDQQKAAAWELIVASIILFFMISYKIDKSRGTNYMTFLTFLMKEDSPSHLLLYIVLFGLVFSSAMSFFT